jgi:hypothetical protein
MKFKRMKRASYRHAVEWIALNDSPADNDPVDQLRGLVTVCLVADLFGVDQDKVAADVFTFREKYASIRQRLEYLRGKLQAECISYDELHELQSLAEYIEPGDVELLEAAGVPESKP